MSTRTGRLGNITIKKEAAYGTYIAGDVQLRAASENIVRQKGYSEDNALVGQIYTTNMIAVSDGAAGSIEGSMHPDTAGILLHGVLGGEAAVSDPIAAHVLLSYNGVSLYQRFTKSGNSLTSELSANGSSWSADANFGTAGTLDISGETVNTLAELVTVITAYTGYDAALFGSGTVSSATLVDFTATQTKNNGEILGAKLMKATVPAATLSKTHTLTPAAASVELPSYSITVNRVLGTNQSVGFVGCKFQNVAISNSPSEGICKIASPVVAQKEEEGKTDIALTIPDLLPYLTKNMKIVAVDSSGNVYTMVEITDISITLNTNIDQSRVVGSEYITEPTRQKATMEISFTAFNTTNSYALRASYTAGNNIQLFVYWLSDETIETGVPYNIMMRFPAIQLTDYNSTLSTPDRLAISAAATVVKPKNTVYTNHVEVLVIDNDTTTY